jgi:hypothetical protein
MSAKSTRPAVVSGRAPQVREKHGSANTESDPSAQALTRAVYNSLAAETADRNAGGRS